MKPIDISTKTILKVFGVPIIAYITWLNKDTLFSLFIAFVIMCSLKPAVDYFHKSKRLKRPLATVLVYIIFLIIVSILFGTILPPIITETLNFFEHLPTLASSMNPALLKYVNLNDISQYIPTLGGQIWSIIGNIFSNTLFLVTTFVFGFYFLSDENLVKNLLGKYTSESTISVTQRSIIRIEERLSGWFWGEITLMLVVGFVSYIGFSIIGLKYALPLAVLAGLLEAVPNIGPTIAAIPATLIGFTQAPIVGFAALAWSFVVQQMENNLLVPYVMRKAVGIHPFVTMLAILLGLRLAGPLGVLLAVPAYVVIDTLILTRLEHKNTQPRE